MISVGIDPGVSNGFALRLGDGEPVHTATYREQQKLWFALAQLHGSDVHVALEGFYGSGRLDIYKRHTIEMVGAIKALCSIWGFHLHTHTAGERLSFQKDAITLLTSQGRKVVMTKDKDDHEVSALSHLLRMEYRLRTGN